MNCDSWILMHGTAAGASGAISCPLFAELIIWVMWLYMDCMCYQPHETINYDKLNH
jgi:hypothetical protein